MIDSTFFRDQMTIRRLRLAAGLVMLSYLTLHLSMHALGNVSFEAMQWGTRIHDFIWHSVPGTIVLYCAFAIHFTLALYALYARRSFRIGAGELVRLVLGFSILPLLLHHFTAGRYVYSAFDVTRRYDVVLTAYFLFVPFWGWRQVTVLLVVVSVAWAARWLVERRRGLINVVYPGGRVARVPVGYAVLDASRRAGIPHAAICGGRGRCTTCRIRVLRGVDTLPPPSASEQALLDRLHAGPSVRLGCQLRPRTDTAVLPLLPPDIVASETRRHDYSEASDIERFVAIMFVDIRRSTALVEKRLPYDVVFLLNHFFDAVAGAVVDTGGTPNQFVGDCMNAIFGIRAGPHEACSQALVAAQLIYSRLADMNRTLADELPEPIAIGVGLHARNVILRSEEHTSELQSHSDLVCRLLL